MDLPDLELVVHIADAGSITHGAARTHLTVPSASARIRALERATSATLFTRKRRAMTPTASTVGSGLSALGGTADRGRDLRGRCDQALRLDHSRVDGRHDGFGDGVKVALGVDLPGDQE